MREYFLGLDLSLTHTGFAVLDDDGGYVTADHLRTQKPRGAFRLSMIVTKIMGLIRMYEPRAIAFERIGANSASQFTSLMIAELHGAFKVALLKDNNYRPNAYNVAPATLKKFATDNGRAQKSDVKMYILKKWGQEFKDDNQADAYVLARMAGQAENVIPTTLKSEMKCLATIRPSLNTVYGTEE